MDWSGHLINLSAGGRLARSGSIQTTAEDIRRVVQGYAASGKPSLTLYFHGGLVGERAGLEQARALMPELEENADSYPVFVVWESGLLETVQSDLVQIVQSSPLFLATLRKVMKHVARKLPAGVGGLLPEFESGPLGGTGNPLTREAVGRAIVVEQIEAGSLPVGDPAALLLLDAGISPEVAPVSPAEQVALQEELASDPDARRALEAILHAARKQAPAGAEGENSPAPESATGYLSPSLLSEMEAAQPPEGVEAELISAAAVWGFASRILVATVNRFRNGTHHGYAGTILEEMYRAMYADKIGKFVWERIQQNARDAYDDNPPGSPSDDMHGGTLFIDLLREKIEESGPISLNLVSHSAGALHICAFVERAGRVLGQKLQIKSIAMAVPACTCERFVNSIGPTVDAIESLRVFALEDAVERRDPVVKWLPLAYPQSLLYLISGLLEDGGPDTPLLGMARHVAGNQPAGTVQAQAQELLQRAGAALVLSPGASNAQADQAAFTSHYGESGPLHDRATLDSIAAMIRPEPAAFLRPLEVEAPAEAAALFEPSASTMMGASRETGGSADGNGVPQPAGFTTPEALEAIIGENDIVDHSLVKALLSAGRAVARIVLSGAEGLHAVPPQERSAAWQRAAENNTLIQGYGTGWIFGRARRLLITNNHVLPLPEAARTASAEFGFERDIKAGARAQMVLRLNPDEFFLTSPNMSFGGLDYTLVALNRPAPEELGYLEPVQGVTASWATNIFIVQHPRGNPKAYVLNHNRKVNLSEQFVTYISDTLEGSSGSPLFDDAVRLVGIHHLGNHRVKIGASEEQTNLGSRIEVVVADIVRQLRAMPGWDEDRVRTWFGEGTVLNAWRAGNP